MWLGVFLAAFTCYSRAKEEYQRNLVTKECPELFHHGKTGTRVMVGNMKESQRLRKNLEWSKGKIHTPARRAISEFTLLMRLSVFSH